MCRKLKLFANSYILFSFIFFLSLSDKAWPYVAKDFSWMPPFAANQEEKPTVHIIFDNSGSMTSRAHSGSFDTSKEYFGYCDNKKYYVYNSDKKRFEPTDKKPNGVNNSLWSGAFLNWCIMHRMDVAKKVMTGGNYDSSTNTFNCQAASHSGIKFSLSRSGVETGGTTVIPQNFFAGANNVRVVHDGPDRAAKSIGWFSVEGSRERYYTQIQGDKQEPTGVIDAFKDKTRMSLFHYERSRSQGGSVRAYVQEDAAGILKLKKDLNDIAAETWTPLAETLNTVYGYIRQDDTYNPEYGPRYYKGEQSYLVTKGASRDPFYFSHLKQLVPCTRQQVILITDGESTADIGVNIQKAPAKYRDSTLPVYENGSYSGSHFLQDVAWWGHTADMRSDRDLPGIQNINLFAVYASFGSSNEGGRRLLRRACALGAFIDANGDGKYTEADLDILGAAWLDNPSTYFQAESGEELQDAVNQALSAAAGNQRSGTAVAVNPQTSSGEGVTYQALFFPPGSDDAPAWTGQVYALFVDKFGNLREDSNGNRKLDPSDLLIQFNRISERPRAYLYDIAENGTQLSLNSTISSLQDIRYLWSSTPWLSNTAAKYSIQRNYTSINTSRHILTFADIDDDMVCDANELQGFFMPSGTAVNKLQHFSSYLTLHDSVAGSRGGLPAPKLQSILAKEQVDFIRGREINKDSLNQAVRSRTMNGKVWLLGDVIYSTPTGVSAPTEAYHLLYDDQSYEAFYKQYRHRRQVVYAGSNGCMLHAFNAGFYNATSKGFDLAYNSSTPQHALGAELWAYVPYNLLPHLRWLMHKGHEKDLNDKQGVHIAGMDLKPRIFDARIFKDDEDHPHGWGTVLVAGMRMGGAEIEVDVTKDQKNIRTMSSAYVIMDITNPEKQPQLLGEIRMPRLGFTTCYPAVMPMSTPEADLKNKNPNGVQNQWYLVFGSGPADNNGKASTSKLGVETSDQNASLYILDLKALARDKKIVTLDWNGNKFKKGTYSFKIAEENSMIGAPTAFDLDIGSKTSRAMKTDAVYFGTASGGNTNAKGRMSRLFTQNTIPSQDGDGGSVPDWDAYVLLDAGLPITAAPTITTDNQKRVWVQFGTGRYYNRLDTHQEKSMSFFAVKEPITSENSGGWPSISWNSTVNSNNLFNSTGIQVDISDCPLNTNGKPAGTKSCVKVRDDQGKLYGGTGQWDRLEADVAQKAGWRYDLSFNATLSRVTQQAAVLAGAVYFTAVTPVGGICTSGETSQTYALFYKTGTPYYKPIFTFDKNIIKQNPPAVDLGKGTASSPSLGVNDNGEVNVFLGIDDGTTLKLTTETPFNPRSHLLYWLER